MSSLHLDMKDIQHGKWNNYWLLSDHIINNPEINLEMLNIYIFWYVK